jgi:Protein of unknown function (DUF1592)/Protein of unknown function (DUF1588)/Protein of unknown function (DUF1587)/Protein of unknown function (DUF1585)/Protein of unknown function (DUF1595)/Planctomycete cytochrome C
VTVHRFSHGATLLLAGLWAGQVHAATRSTGGQQSHFAAQIRPILVNSCYECHDEGSERGEVAFDTFKTEDALVADRGLWVRVLKNIRAGLMPPTGHAALAPAKVRRLESWIKKDVLGLDARNPDPGRITIRRLNRIEYRNTIRDLMGFDFKVEEELPPDDTGYGFDNIGDVLTLSPMLLEKYMQAAESIASSIPRARTVARERFSPGAEFKDGSGKASEKYSFYDPNHLSQTIAVPETGTYRLDLEVEVSGQFDFDPGRVLLAMKADDREFVEREFQWQSGKRFHVELGVDWKKGNHTLTLDLSPLVPADKKVNSINLRIKGLVIRGPMDPARWVRPKNFELFFSKDSPTDPVAQRQYAIEVLRRFTTRAFRRPTDDLTVLRLASMAESVYTKPGKSFEDGISQAIVPVLASPRFLFRVEDVTVARDSKHPLVDEYSLASRLSYFLWSTMPDDALLELARTGRLRKNLKKQVKRMLADPKAIALSENFTGQWLQARDVEGIDIDARTVLARDLGQEKEIEQLRQQARAQKMKDAELSRPLTPAEIDEREKARAARRKFFGTVVELDKDVRRAMREESEKTFAHILKGNQSLLELISSDYTFLNEKLANHYGITGVTGTEMRLVKLPKDSSRGGVLTQGTVLVVTSNPTRTSPVKRGLFVLDNILGIPPPPPPANIPPLEGSEGGFGNREPTLREVLAIHRGKPLCNSCHNRMDPLGLALDNFNAMGMWRDRERNQAIDTSGKLITGEPFVGIGDIKRIIATSRRLDFYRCFSEKLLTYALGRGLEDYDTSTVDLIVERLDRDKGKIMTLLTSMIESSPFQKRRLTNPPAGSQ